MKDIRTLRMNINFQRNDSGYFCGLRIVMTKRDIQNREDIAQWMNAFYTKLMTDDITRPKFLHLNLEAHLPKIVQFWAFVLLDEEGYTTNVFNQHTHLNLEEIHFRRWIDYFVTTTDEMFEGQKATLAKQRAKLLASTFWQKISGVYVIF